MASRPIRRQRWAILDDLGVEEIAEIYWEKVRSVKELCHYLFEQTEEGTKPGSKEFYDWINYNGHREYWRQTVSIKKEMERDRVLDFAVAHMDQLDRGDVTKAEVEEARRAIDAKIFEVSRRGGF